jgi:hypothetical protein
MPCNTTQGIAASGEAQNLESIPNRFGATPVLTRLPDGSALALPWRS